jgi:hypothetical protein
MILLLACTSAPVDSDLVETTGPTAVVLTVAGDYTSAAVAEVSLDTRAISDTLAPTSTDPGAMRVDFGGPMLAILERYGTDVVRLYDAAGAIDWNSPIAEFSTGERSNPLAIQACGDALVVARYGSRPSACTRVMALRSVKSTCRCTPTPTASPKRAASW